MGSMFETATLAALANIIAAMTYKATTQAAYLIGIRISLINLAHKLSWISLITT